MQPSDQLQWTVHSIIPAASYEGAPYPSEAIGKGRWKHEDFGMESRHRRNMLLNLF